MKKAIFLAGGGARGAYQAGVLHCISDIIGGGQFPADILSTVSAGAINGSLLAMHATDIKLATSNLVDLWSKLTCDQVFEAGNTSLLRSVARNLGSIIFHMDSKDSQHLFDTAPLDRLLREKLDFDCINQNIQKGLLTAFEVSTTCFESAQTVSFVHAQDTSLGWRKIRHHSQSANITRAHIMASSAFPLFFPVVKINSLHYGDGGVRQTAPLRASIKLGAEAILIIGTRRVPSADVAPPKPIRHINFAKIFGSLFNAFLDNIDRELEHIETINHNFRIMDEKTRKRSHWREIKTLHLTPSRDIAKIAAQKETSMPYLLRYMMDALGKKEQSGDLLSFLLFESVYTKDLIEIGYNDTLKRKHEVEQFFAL